MKYYLILFILFLSVPLLAAIVSIVDYPQLQQIIQNSNKPVLLNFTWSQCGACEQIKAPFNAVASSDPYNDKVIFAQVDIEQHPTIAKQYSVVAAPTFIYIRNNSIIHQETGISSINSFEAHLRNNLDHYFFDKESATLWNSVANIFHTTTQTVKNIWNYTVRTIKGWFSWS